MQNERARQILLDRQRRVATPADQERIWANNGAEITKWMSDIFQDVAQRPGEIQAALAKLRGSIRPSPDAFFAAYYITLIANERKEFAEGRRQQHFFDSFFAWNDFGEGIIQAALAVHRAIDVLRRGPEQEAIRIIQESKAEGDNTPIDPEHVAHMTRRFAGYHNALVTDPTKSGVKVLEHYVVEATRERFGIHPSRNFYIVGNQSVANAFLAGGVFALDLQKAIFPLVAATNPHPPKPTTA